MVAVRCMWKKRLLYTILMMNGILLLFCSTSSVATEIRLKCQDEFGTSIALSKAELLLTWWGGRQSTPLPYSNNTVVIRIDNDWIQQYWSRPISDLWEMRILLQADGYAPQISDLMKWPRQSLSQASQSSAQIKTLHFPGNQDLTVIGDVIDVPVTFYRPQPRSIQFVDDVGMPIPDLQVTAYMFWSAANHCGVFYKDFPIGDFITDTDGQISIKEAGNFEYLLSVHEMYDQCFEEAFLDSWCNQTKATLNNVHTQIKIHRFHQITFDLIVKYQGKVQRNFVLYGHAPSPCMFSGGMLAEPDSNGVFHVTCYPERLIDIWLGDPDREKGLYGNKDDVWYLDIDTFQDGQKYIVDLENIEKGISRSKLYQHRS